MSHSLSLGVTTSDPNVLNKSYSFGTSVTVNLKEDSSVISPVFILDYKANYSQYNYAYFPDWGRFYYIRNMVMKPGQKCELVCAVDPLMSFRNQISGLTVNVVRQENLVEPYLPDDRYVYLDTYDVISMLPTSYGNSQFLQDSNATGSYFVLGLNGGANEHIEDIEGYTRITEAPSTWSADYYTYFINRGTISQPSLYIVRAAIEDGLITAEEAQNFATLSALYSVYQHNG